MATAKETSVNIAAAAVFFKNEANISSLKEECLKLEKKICQTTVFSLYFQLTLGRFP